MAMQQLGNSVACNRRWTSWAISRIEADFCRSADTHLVPVPMPHLPNIALYLKDEASHPTGSLKHRLARSLFLYALCNGWISEGQTIIEASSGSTAVSEAYFARMLNLPFVAVVPRSTAQAKIDAIEFYGGSCHFVDQPSEIYAAAHLLAAERNGHYLDQFTYAERATDWRGNNNIAESIFAQMSREPHPIPRWIVCGAGTGGTSATIGRYVRYFKHDTKICVPDPETSVFHRHWQNRSIRLSDGKSSLIEGIGRPQVEPSFMPDLIDRMFSIADTDSVAAMRVVSEILGRKCGASTGTNIWACVQLAVEMQRRGEGGSIVSILCDDGERYAATLFNDEWLAERGIDIAPSASALRKFFADGTI